MNRGEPMKRTPFARTAFKRSASAKNTPSKVDESYSQKAPKAIKCIVKMQPKTPPVTPAFQGAV